MGLCHSCLTEDESGGTGLTPVGPTPAATAAGAVSPPQGLWGGGFPRLTGVACAVVAACLLSVSNSVMLAWLPHREPLLQHQASHGGTSPQRVSSAPLCPSSHSSVPLCACPQQGQQANKPGGQPVTAVGPQGLFDLPLADSRVAAINTRLLCTYFNSIFLSGRSVISATCF